MLKEKIYEIKEQILYEADLVMKMLKKCYWAIENNDITDLVKLQKEYEVKVDKAELDIEKRCINFIALYQPEAGTLRAVVMMLKINSDLERIGDLVENITESIQILFNSQQLVTNSKILRMIKVTLDMYQKAIDAFISLDLKGAKEIKVLDDEIDHFNEEIIKTSMKLSANSVTEMQSIYGVIRIAHNLERIGDLSTNIAENTIYMLDGSVIAHQA